MGIELQGDEGEVTVIDYSGAAEITAEAAEGAASTEEMIVEAETTEEAVEETTQTEVDDNAAGGTEVYSQEEVVELMKIHEQKIMEEIQRQETAAARPAATEETPVRKSSAELVGSTLDEVLAGVGDEDLVSGKDIKEILNKTFSALNNKAEEYNTTAESVKFDNATDLYATKFVPDIIKNYKLDPNSRDAKFVQNSFLTTLIQHQRQYGRTEHAAKAAATAHMLEMSKEFGTATPAAAAAKPATIIERKLASGNTGTEPSKPKNTGIDPAVVARVEKGTASTAQLLKLINARK